MPERNILETRTGKHQSFSVKYLLFFLLLQKIINTVESKCTKKHFANISLYRCLDLGNEIFG